jgi:hypothetical protein
MAYKLIYKFFARISPDTGLAILPHPCAIAYLRVCIFACMYMCNYAICLFCLQQIKYMCVYIAYPCIQVLCMYISPDSDLATPPL